MNDALVILFGVVILSLAVAIGYMVFKIVKAYTDFLKGVSDE